MDDETINDLKWQEIHLKLAQSDFELKASRDLYALKSNKDAYQITQAEYEKQLDDLKAKQQEGRDELNAKLATVQAKIAKIEPPMPVSPYVQGVLGEMKRYQRDLLVLTLTVQKMKLEWALEDWDKLQTLRHEQTAKQMAHDDKEEAHDFFIIWGPLRRAVLSDSTKEALFAVGEAGFDLMIVRDLVVAGTGFVEKIAVGTVGKNAARLELDVAGSARSLLSKTNQALELLKQPTVADLKAAAAAAATNACFIQGTPLLTPDGSKAIEDFKVGEPILSADENDATCKVQIRYVEQVLQQSSLLIRIQLAGREISLTPDHPVFVKDRGWVQAGELVPGDHVLGHDGKTVSIDRIEEDGRLQTVYNLTVSEFHTFFVGGTNWGFSIWVHNSELCRLIGAVDKALAAGSNGAYIDAKRALIDYIGKAETDASIKADLAENLAKPGQRANLEVLIGTEGTKVLSKVAPTLSTLEERIALTPAGQYGTPSQALRGKWTGERGKSTFIPADTPENAEILAILKKNGLDGIAYRDGKPVFKQLVVGTVTTTRMTSSRYNNFLIADELLAKQWGWTTKEVTAYRVKNDLTWHEMNDVKTMQLVPSNINNFFDHLGGVSEAQRLGK